MGTTIQRRDNTTRETPPPPVRDGDGTRPAGSEILDEVPGDLGVVLWLALRRVNGWVLARQRRSRTDGDPAAATDDRATDAEPFAMREAPERPALNAAGEEAPELWDALRTFVLLCEMPDLVRPEQFRDACGEVWKWAEDGDRIQTAAYFAEAAAYLDPLSPEWANEAGRSCRRAALYSRAAMWFHRAFGLGLRVKNRRQCTLALLRFGVLLHQLGAYDEAETYLLKTKRRAVGSGQRSEVAAAHHELLLVSAEARSYGEGESHAFDALWFYPRHHERLPILVYDVTYLFCEKHLYSHALSLVQPVLSRVSSPSIQALIWGNAARAFAATGRRERYSEAVERATELGNRYQENASGAFTMAAVGAWMAGDLDRAERLAVAGRDIGARRKERIAIRRADEVLSGLEERLPSPREAEGSGQLRIEQLSRECLARLRIWRSR
jgi:tetratricopeptide (TPR) repeat protein